MEPDTRTEIQQRIKTLAQRYAPEFVTVRRHLHQNPELSFKEHRTCAYIKEQLLALGITDIVSVAGTGLLASIPAGQNGKSVLLRSDIDALPIEEQNQLPYRSKNKGVMHACGHDAHIASLLLCAKILWEIKDCLRGGIKLLFQPGEEVMPGGASLVMREKAYRDLGSLPHIGQHVRPDLPMGKIGFRSGTFMASMDELYVRVIGKGGHAAMPEDAIDSVLIASHIIIAAQQLVSRMAPPKTPSVLSFGKVMAAGTVNILPDQVVLEGTFRTLDGTWRKTALQKLEKLMTSIAEGMGGECELTVRHGYPHVVNDPGLTQALRNSAESYLGIDNVLDMDPWMAAEDFAYYSLQNPACFYMLGVGNEEKGINSGLHTPTFDLDENALEIGGGLMAWLATENL